MEPPSAPVSYTHLDVYKRQVRARELGARTVMVACTPIDAEFERAVDQAIIAVTGPEVVTGSTRLKAGTATKMILNMLTCLLYTSRCV